MNDEPRPGRLEQTLRELGEDAETLQRAAAVLDDAVGEMQPHAASETLRSSAAQIQSGAVALSLTLLGIVAQAERILALTGEGGSGAPEDRDATRPASRAGRDDREEALLEWQEFVNAIQEILRHARAQAACLSELQADIGALGAAEGDRNRVDALRVLGDGSARALAGSEQIAEALAQICAALSGWSVAASLERTPLRRRRNDRQTHQEND